MSSKASLERELIARVDEFYVLVMDFDKLLVETKALRARLAAAENELLRTKRWIHDNERLFANAPQLGKDCD